MEIRIQSKHAKEYFDSLKTDIDGYGEFDDLVSDDDAFTMVKLAEDEISSIYKECFTKVMQEILTQKMELSNALERYEYLIKNHSNENNQ